DWGRIANLYAVLSRGWPSPVIELNRAIAVGFAEGPAAGLAVLDTVAEAPALQRYHLLPSVRGDLLLRLGRTAEARAEFLRGAALAGNAQERAFLNRRAADCG
ncbi:MAG: RNA polymerase sigma factor, partial [Phenylobacterium sp.]|nr:RNA polymerase sigma factor [Phenylobacterium sp.]